MCPKRTKFFLLMVVVIINAKADDNNSPSTSPFKSRVSRLSGTPCSSKGRQGICTFLWHCRSRGGEAIAACASGILVGTCCYLPPNSPKLDPSPASSVDTLNHRVSVTEKPLESSQQHNAQSTKSSIADVTSPSTVSAGIWEIWTPNPTKTSASTASATTVETSTMYPSSIQSIIHSLATADGGGEVTYAPSNQWLVSNPSTGKSVTPSVDYFNPYYTATTQRSAHIVSFPVIDHHSNETHDFPLAAIQQIIDDFANQTPANQLHSDIPSWWQHVVTAESSVADAEITAKITTPNETRTTPMTTIETVTQTTSAKPVLKFPIISINVKNSTSSVSVVESVPVIQEVSYTDTFLDFIPQPDSNSILQLNKTVSKPPITTTTPTTITTSAMTTTTTKPTTPRRKITKKPTRKTTTSTKATTTTTKPWNYKTDCGVRPLAPTGRIVGGKKVTLGQWPWQALVKEATWFGLVVKTKCGGVLISRKFVITAAHCQPGWLASLLVLLGENDLAHENVNLQPIQRNIRRVIAHRDFVPATFENDIALLEMDRPIDLQPHIVPACLPAKNAEFTGKKAIVSGWGRLSSGGPLPSVLHYVDVPILSNSGCQQMFLKAGQVKAIKNSFICAGYERGGKDSCEGDSGGPLTVQGDDGRWILVGTVSHGIKCAFENLPGVYTRISSFRDWIDRFVTY